MAVFFFWRVLEFSSSSFLQSIINLRHPSVTISVHLWASWAACFQFCWILKDRTSLSTHATHSFSCPPRPFLTPYFIVPNITRLGSRPSYMRVRAPAHNNLLARRVASILSHPVSSSARLRSMAQRTWETEGYVCLCGVFHHIILTVRSPIISQNIT